MNYKKFLFSAALTAMCFSAFAGPISSFNFNGLKRTKASYLEKVLSRFYGQEADEKTLHDIETVLQAEGLFEAIEINAPEESRTDAATESISDANSTNPDSVTINITLKEKICFIPIPFLMVSNGDWYGGGVIMNMNAFGNKTLLMSGLFASKTKLTAIFGLSKPAANTEDLGWSLFTGISNNSSEVSDLYDDEFVQYESKGASMSASLSKKVTDFTTVSAGTGIDYKYFSEKNNYILPFPEESSFNLKASASFSHGVNDWNDWFLNSKSLSAGAEAGWDFIRKEDFYKASAAITFQQEITKRLRFSTTAAGTYGKNLLLTDWSSGSSAAVMILPSDFVSCRMAGGNTGLELAVKKFSFGLLSIYGNYQAVYLQNIDEEYKFCQGGAGGIRLYLSKIAFPAFAFGMGRNVTTKNWYYSASLGVSF